MNDTQIQFYIEKMFRIASERLEVLPKPLTASVAAGLVYKNRLLVIGVNQTKTHPLQAEFSKHKESVFLHAEVDAIRIFNNQLQIPTSKLTMFVSRAKKSFRNNKLQVPGLAKPCSGCQKCLKHFGINHVYYTTDIPGEVKRLYP